MKVKFKDWDCILKIGKYKNGATALSLIGTGEEIGEPIATCTVALIDRPIPEKGYVWIKEYSENEGMTEALIKAGVIENEFKLSTVGYGSAVCLCKLKIK